MWHEYIFSAKKQQQFSVKNSSQCKFLNNKFGCDISQQIQNLEISSVVNSLKLPKVKKKIIFYFVQVMADEIFIPGQIKHLRRRWFCVLVWLFYRKLTFIKTLVQQRFNVCKR